MTTIEKIDYEEAVERYFESFGEGADFPSESASGRNENDSGWVLRNSYRKLAFVPDLGGVLVEARMSATDESGPARGRFSVPGRITCDQSVISNTPRGLASAALAGAEIRLGKPGGASGGQPLRALQAGGRVFEPRTAH